MYQTQLLVPRGTLASKDAGLKYNLTSSISKYIVPGNARQRVSLVFLMSAI